MKSGPKVPPGRDEEIARRYQAGELAQDIAADYGLSRQRVWQILVRLGVERRPTGRSPVADDVRAEASRRYGEGVPTAEIVAWVEEQTGRRVVIRTIAYWAAAAGVDRPPRGERHGRYRYEKGCRCPECKRAMRENKRRYVERRKARGLCQAAGCSRSPAPDRTLCAEHLERLRATSKARRGGTGRIEQLRAAASKRRSGK